MLHRLVWNHFNPISQVSCQSNLTLGSMKVYNAPSIKMTGVMQIHRFRELKAVRLAWKCLQAYFTLPVDSLVCFDRLSFVEIKCNLLTSWSSTLSVHDVSKEFVTMLFHSISLDHRKFVILCHPLIFSSASITIHKAAQQTSQKVPVTDMKLSWWQHWLRTLRGPHLLGCIIFKVLLSWLPSFLFISTK